VVGAGELGQRVIETIEQHRELGFTVTGVLTRRPEKIGTVVKGAQVLGLITDVDQVLDAHPVDQVIIALPSASHDLQLRIVELCREARVGFKLVPDLFEMSLSRVDLDMVSGVPLIGLREVAITGWDHVLKRSLDIGLTLLALIPGSVIMVVVALLVRIDSPGPIIFRQQRVGRGGRSFTCYKFRSMRDGADRELESVRPMNEQDSVLFKIRHDPRLTRVGRIIRRASLDELPQLFNVLRGEMSLVGPRPPLPREVESYEKDVLRRLRVRPGMTGLWQVSGRTETSFADYVRYDLFYIQNWSLSLDLWILWRTLRAVLTAEGAH
jgi:exopolysaccharide biosynthesis polyprenyl glycosylphosphotransferase